MGPGQWHGNSLIEGHVRMVQREPLDAAFPSPLPSTLVALQRDLPLRPTASRRCAQGVFSLATAGHPCPETVLQNPDVDGVSIRQAWADLEPSEGAFDWSFLDSEVSRAAAAGKQVLLRINTQANKPTWVSSGCNRSRAAPLINFLDTRRGPDDDSGLLGSPSSRRKKP